MSSDAKPEAQLGTEPPPKTMFEEFREFIARGNAIDLAVGVVMGTAFNKIVNSIVTDLVMPPIGYVISGVDFKDMIIPIGSKVVEEAGKVTTQVVGIKIGAFLNAVIEFFIVAMSVFFAVKMVNAMMAYRVPFLTAEEELAAADAKKKEKK